MIHAVEGIVELGNLVANVEFAALVNHVEYCNDQQNEDEEPVQFQPSGLPAFDLRSRKQHFLKLLVIFVLIFWYLICVDLGSSVDLNKCLGIRLNGYYLSIIPYVIQWACAVAVDIIPRLNSEPRILSNKVQSDIDYIVVLLVVVELSLFSCCCYWCWWW